jgi:protein-disulfide isomerase
MKKKELKKQANGGSSLAIIITFVITATVIVCAPVLSGCGQARATPQQVNISNYNNKLSLHNLILQGSPMLGKTSAPITIVEFGDFQCDRCARFAKYTESQVNQTYIQTGKAILVFKYFPIYGPDSTPAAMAAQCVNDQGKFWNYYELLFKNQGPPNFGWASKDNLKRFASQIPEINMNKFNSCLDGQKYLSYVQKDFAFATSLGLQGTPTFIIERSDGSNSQTLPGAYPFPSFQAIIDKELGG